MGGAVIGMMSLYQTCLFEHFSDFRRSVTPVIAARIFAAAILCLSVSTSGAESAEKEFERPDFDRLDQLISELEQGNPRPSEAQRLHDLSLPSTEDCGDGHASGEARSTGEAGHDCPQ